MKKSEAVMFAEVYEAGFKFPADSVYTLLLKLMTIRRLALKHRRLAEMDCNGEGYIRGQGYYSGVINDYVRRTYGAGVMTAYANSDNGEENTTVFGRESEKVEDKITALVGQLGAGWAVEYQGDPRGWTVKLSYQGRSVNVNE